MPELIKNAWIGWQTYIEAGKLPVILLAVFLFIFIYRNMQDSFLRSELISGMKERTLLLYTAVMTGLCICPVTAAALMLYQTKFYNYEWIWSYVPMTAAIAAGVGEILMLIWRKRYTAKDRVRAVTITILIACVAVLCGSVGVTTPHQTAVSSGNSDYGSAVLVQYDETAFLMAEIEAAYEEAQASEGGNTAICLWAPQEILTYARQYSADIQLLYGRNMWDNALNAYTYDTYSEEYVRMYEWMELVSEYGEAGDEAAAEGPESRKCVENAVAAGVNVIVLPGNTLEKTRAEVAELTGAQEAQIRDCFVYII